MKLNHGLHLAYCTNVHRGEDWAETFEALEKHTLAVKQRVCPDQPFAIGLRLSNRASEELSHPHTLDQFKLWLKLHNCYVFTINGFPFGRFHGGRVKEQVYRPDWTSPERLAYTNRLFDLLAQLVPPGVEGSVSTLPGSFKEFITSAEQEKAIRDNIWFCVEHIAALSARTGRKLHLGLNPNRSAGSRTPPKPSVSSNNSAPNIPTIRASTNTSGSTTTPAISLWNLKNRKTPSAHCKKKASRSANFTSVPR